MSSSSWCNKSWSGKSTYKNDDFPTLGRPLTQRSSERRRGSASSSPNLFAWPSNEQPTDDTHLQVVSRSSKEDLHTHRAAHHSLY
jgi:hypothetical protein